MRLATPARALPGRPRLLVALAVLLLPALAAAQETTFTVTVGDKTESSPNPGGPIPAAYYVDDVEGRELHLTRGVTYTFQMDGVPGMHPFYISTSAAGGGVDVVDEGVTNNFATGNEALTFTPGAATPDLVYYQCGSHTLMGWRLYVTDPGPQRVALEEVAGGFTSPVGMAMPPDGSGRYVVVDQKGLLRVVTAGGEVLDAPFLDLRDRMVNVQEGYDERGLLGLAFHPGYATNGRLFVYYSAPLRDGAPNSFDHTTHVSEFTVSTDPDVADPASERVLLRVDQPQFNHNGGTIAFGPDDGFLYVSLGDGGNADDVGEGHVEDWYAANEGGNGQDVMQSLLGKILRIDVDTGDPYGIPADNPFVGRDGLDEIYAYGFRNPWRFSFDLEGDHDLLVGDAGQNLWEEVSVVTNGGNYGWNVREGTHCFSTANPDASPASCPSAVGAGHPDTGDALLGPVVEYPHPGIAGGYGLVVVAGHVYRGDDVPSLAGRYVFADWSDSFGAPSGQLFVATPRDEGLWAFETLALDGAPDGTIDRYILALGQDVDGEVYVLTTDSTGPSGTTGRMFRLAPGVVSPGTEAPPAAARARLDPGAPNPFAEATTLRYALLARGHVTLTVSDVLGREVRRLADGPAAEGAHEVRFDAAGLPSGTYFVRLAVDGVEAAVQRVVLAR
jgi:glucose/arabinose dehydrogenase